MKPGAWLTAAVATIVCTACRATGDVQRTVRSSMTATSVEAALDSCEAANWSAQDTVSPRHQHTRLTGRVRSYERFSIWVPDSARVTVDSATHGVGLSWP